MTFLLKAGEELDLKETIMYDIWVEVEILCWKGDNQLFQGK